jgi:hypothetical protein
MPDKRLKYTLILPVLLLSLVNSGSAQWRDLNLGDVHVHHLDLYDSVLYAATEAGVARLDLRDEAAGWTSLGLDTVNVHTILVYSSDTMFAGNRVGPVFLYRSTNGGAVWEPFENGWGGDQEFRPVLAMDRIPGSEDIFSTGLAVIGKSSNLGLDWQIKWGGWEYLAMGMVFVKVDYNDPSIVWAGGESAILHPWLLKSTDSGNTFELVNVYFAGDNRAHDIAIAPAISDIAFVSMEGLVRKTVDGGTNWTTILSNEYYLYGIEIDRNNPMNMYTSGATSVGTPPLTLFLTHDGGSTWRTVADDSYSQNYSEDILLMPSNDINTIFFATLHGVHAYADSPIACCNGITGNVDGDEGELVDIGDLTALIDYLYIENTPPICQAEANIDGDSRGSVDIGDLTALIDYLYISLIPPSPCP